MAQILLIEPDPTLRTILKLNIMKSIGGDVIEKESGSDAISLLQILPNIDLIICREQVGKEQAGLKLSEFLKKEAMSIPLLIIGNKVSDYKQLMSIDSNQSWTNIISLAGRILGIELQFDSKNFIMAYIPVSAHYFLNLAGINLECDVYLRVKKTENEFQYIKRIHAGDQILRMDVEKYQEMGLKEFYISKTQFTEFVDFVTKKLIAQIGHHKMEGENLIHLASDVYEVTLDRLHSLGIDDYTIELVEESVHAMESSLNEKNALTNFLSLLKNNKLGYAYAHSYLSSLILHKIVDQFDWESSKVREKLTYIAYFHDISLQNTELMRVNDASQFEAATLTTDEKKTINEHALASANIIERFPKVPNGIGTIIKEHHGSKTGIGIPEALSISIAPISMMFIVVEHFVDEFMKIKETPKSSDLEAIFTVFHKRYNKLTYQQTLFALESMILKKSKQVG